MSEPLKITFEKELTGLGKTFESVSVIRLPLDGEYYLSDLGDIRRAIYDFSIHLYPILTPKKTTYTVIKVEGDFVKGYGIHTAVEGIHDYWRSHGTLSDIGTVEVVNE